MAATGATPVAPMALLDSAQFPALSNAPASSSTTPAQPRLLDRLWSNIIAEPAPSSPHIPVSLMETTEEIIPFDKDFTEQAAAEWNLCLVGYSIGSSDSSPGPDGFNFEFFKATWYAIVCDLRNYSSIERLRRIKGVGNSKPLSILCRSLQDIDIYTTGFPRGNAYGQTNIFRAVKHCLPGPYTFILPASKELPKQCIRSGPSAKYTSRKHVGVRIPDDIICQTILKNLDAPLISTSVKCPAENQWMIDPVMIADIYEPEGLDFLVDGGIRVADPSTVVDMTISPPTIIRLGKGPRLDWMDVEGEDPSAQENLLPLSA